MLLFIMKTSSGDDFQPNADVSTPCQWPNVPPHHDGLMQIPGVSLTSARHMCASWEILWNTDCAQDRHFLVQFQYLLYNVYLAALSFHKWSCKTYLPPLLQGVLFSTQKNGFKLMNLMTTCSADTWLISLLNRHSNVYINFGLNLKLKG